MSEKKYRTDILFPRASFLIGAGSVFNLAGNYFEFNTSQTEEEADSLAIESDWGMVGDDLRSIMAKNPKKPHPANA